MDRSTSSIVKGGEIVEPSVAVPGPACDGAVDDCGPDEGEQQRWKDSASLKRATDHDLTRTGAEEELVQAEYDVGDQGRSRGRCSSDVLESEVGEVTNEGVCSSRIGKRVALDTVSLS